MNSKIILHLGHVCDNEYNNQIGRYKGRLVINLLVLVLGLIWQNRTLNIMMISTKLKNSKTLTFKLALNIEIF